MWVKQLRLRLRSVPGSVRQDGAPHGTHTACVKPSTQRGQRLSLCVALHLGSVDVQFNGNCTTRFEEIRGDKFKKPILADISGTVYSNTMQLAHHANKVTEHM